MQVDHLLSEEYGGVLRLIAGRVGSCMISGSRVIGGCRAGVVKEGDARTGLMDLVAGAMQAVTSMQDVARRYAAYAKLSRIYGKKTFVFFKCMWFGVPQDLTMCSGKYNEGLHTSMDRKWARVEGGATQIRC